MRTWRKTIHAAFLIQLISSCSSQNLSNGINQQILRCGDQPSDGHDHIYVPSNLSDIIGNDNFEKIEVHQLAGADSEMQKIRLSSKGCLLLNPGSSGSLIIKALGFYAKLPNQPMDESSSIDFSRYEAQYSVALKNSRQQFSRFESIAITRSPELKLKSCLKRSNDPLNRCLNDSGNALWANNEFHEFDDSIRNLPEDTGPYRLYVLAMDPFERQNLFTFDLHINNQPPEIAPDFVSPSRLTLFNDVSTYAVKSDYTLKFSSNIQPGKVNIQYCIDRFSEQTKDPAQRCSNANIQTFLPTKPIKIAPGFWQISFSAKDSEGNQSEWQTQNLLVEEECEAADLLDEDADRFCTHIRGGLSTRRQLGFLSNASLQKIMYIEGTLELNGGIRSDWIKTFRNLHSVGGLTIKGTNFVDMSFFQNLEIIRGSLQIQYTDKLMNFYGLERLRSISGDVLIEENLRLESFHGLSSIESIGGKLKVIGNEVLADLNGLENLRALEDVELINNSELKTVGLFKNIKVAGEITLKDLPRLTDLTDLSSLERVSYLHVSGLMLLKNLRGLENLREATFGLEITENSAIEDVFALSQLENVNSIFITSNENLTGLFKPRKDLENWPIKDSLHIRENAKLCQNIDESLPANDELYLRIIDHNCW